METREECPRQRFLGFDYGEPGDPAPTGLETEAHALPLLSGIAIHAAHARLLAGQPIDTVVRDVISGYVTELNTRGLFNIEVTKELVREQSALLEAMLRTWAVVRLPRILEEYEVESIEQRWDWEMAPGLVERIRMDAILKRRDDGLRHILDYKTVGYPSELFFDQKEHSKQTALYVKALQERTGEPVGGIIYEGLVKGVFKKDTAKNSPWYGQKIQQSPYVLAYALKGEAGSLYQTEYTAKKGWQKVRTFLEMSPKEWVEHHLLRGGEGMVDPRELFIVMPPISPTQAELEEQKDQTVYEETVYHTQLEDYRGVLARERAGLELPGTAERMLRRFAPKRPGRCYRYGADHKCKFIDICWNQGAEPLAEGSGYVKRKPHHDTDLEFVG